MFVQTNIRIIRQYSSSLRVDGWKFALKIESCELVIAWHRVERALAAFEREVEELRAQGWRAAD